MPEAEMFDAGGNYVLTTRRLDGALSNAAAGALLREWIRRDPQRTRLRVALRRVVGGSVGTTVSDVELVEQARRLIALGRLHVARDGAQLRGGGGLHIGGSTEEGESDEGDVVADEPTIDPCDFETLVLTCGHMGSKDRSMADARFWKSGMNVVNNLQPPSGGRAFVRMIEVVGHHTDGDADDVTVTLEGGPGYTCSRSHPKVTITSPATDREVHEGETSVQFKAKCRDLPTPPAAYSSIGAIIGYHFFPTQTLNVYTIDVESCGRLDDGSYGFGRTQQKVRVYPKDLYKLSLSIPPFKKKSFEASRMTHDDGRLVTKAELASGGLTGDKEKLGVTVDDDGISFDHEKKPVDGPLDQIAPGFSLTRNGNDLEGAAKIGQLIHGLVTLEKQIQEIMNFIREFQPQVGWKFVFEIELFKGDLAYEWGYKEWNDHTVFEWWKVEVGMTLFALKLELSFGADLRVCGFGITALIYGSVGVEAAVKASKEATPDDSAPLAIEVEGGPKGELGIRSALGADWVTAEGKLTVGLTFKAELKCGGGEALHIPWVLDYDGVKAKVTGSVKWVGSIERKWTLSDGKKPWKRGRFL